MKQKMFSRLNKTPARAGAKKYVTRYKRKKSAAGITRYTQAHLKPTKPTKESEVYTMALTLEEYAKQQWQAQSEEQPERQRTKLEAEQEWNEQARQQALDVRKKYQLNIRKTETLSTEIMKGLQKGESLASLFLKAVKAYTLCTGNNAEYNIIEETLQTVYGKALRETGAAELEADAIRNRLETLQAAYNRTDNERDRSRIEQAIEAHKKELANLLNI